MRLFAIIMTTTISFSAFAGEIPFQKYYGTYEIVSCKNLESGPNSDPDYCKSKTVQIELAPPNMGAPHTSMYFSAPNQKTHEEIFSSGDGLNPEYYKLEKDDKGRDHYYISGKKNNAFSVITNAWLNEVPSEKTVLLQLQRNESSLSSGSKTSSFDFEIKLKRSANK